MPTTDQRIALCALTYLRPDGLARLLEGLDELIVPPSTEVLIVIVDNDPHESARDMVSRHVAPCPFEVRYVHEPARGISTARNAAVQAALDWDAQSVCFIDDDEWPDPVWLRELVATAEQTGADIVTGPVLPVFDEPPPSWMIDGEFFERRRHEHHERIRYATTSNVLIGAQCFAERPNPFDLAFGMSGGEDTHLFAELREAGFVSVWCDTALVYEAIPSSRVDTRWILRREYRRGQTLSLSLRRRGPSAMAIVRRVGNGLLNIARGLVGAIIGLRRGRAGVLSGTKQIVFGAGMMTGLAGRRYQEYEHTHGS